MSDVNMTVLVIRTGLTTAMVVHFDGKFGRERTESRKRVQVRPQAGQ